MCLRVSMTKSSIAVFRFNVVTLWKRRSLRKYGPNLLLLLLFLWGFMKYVQSVRIIYSYLPTVFFLITEFFSLVCGDHDHFNIALSGPRVKTRIHSCLRDCQIWVSQSFVLHTSLLPAFGQCLHEHVRANETYQLIRCDIKTNECT
jgi:hypothetical protein